MERKWKGRHMIVNPGTVKVKETPRKYMRLTEASKYYGIGLTKFRDLLRESGAMYRVDGMILVNLDRFDEYLETFRVTEDRYE